MTEDFSDLKTRFEKNTETGNWPFPVYKVPI